MSQSFETQVLLSVQVKYDILPAEDQFPDQVDIQDVWLVVRHPTTGKERKVHILGALSEGECIAIEDEILGENP
jgi:hypothetical protein